MEYEKVWLTKWENQWKSQGYDGIHFSKKKKKKKYTEGKKSKKKVDIEVEEKGTEQNRKKT